MLWAALIVAAAYAAGPGAPSLDLMAAAVYGMGAVICHQQPERSFVLSGAQWPVCARCTGIYMGAALAVLGLVAAGQPSRFASPFDDDNATRKWRIAILAAVGINLVTLLYEWSIGVTPSNLTRAVAGSTMGVVVAAFIWATVQDRPGPRVNQVH